MEENSWYAIQTWNGHEESCSVNLVAKGYQIFLPRYRSVQGPASARTGKQADKVLFPGYLFCQFTSKVRGKIVTTPGVVRILGIGGKPVPVLASELDHIRQIVSSGSRAYACRRFQKGASVLIKNGPLKGVSGILLSDQNERRLFVSVSLLQRGVLVELSNDTELSLERET
jgi:transcription antitermination factor NusG